MDWEHNGFSLFEPDEVTVRRWQTRAMRLTHSVDFYLVVMSVIAHTWDQEAMRKILWVLTGSCVFEHSFICSVAKINHSGQVVADFQRDDGRIEKNKVIYPSAIKLRDRFRELADDLKLSDADRLEMFAAVQRWLAADQRLDPTMNPMDPDAKRLVH